MTPEDRRLAYAQQFELFRYQDGLRWSRVKTVAVIEAVLAYGITDSSPVPDWLKTQMVAATVLLVLFVSLLAVKDDIDASYHVRVAAELGAEMGIPLRERTRLVRIFRGRVLLAASLAVVNVFNFWVLYKVWCR